jgi:hypothetical protein
LAKGWAGSLQSTLEWGPKHGLHSITHQNPIDQVGTFHLQRDGAISIRPRRECLWSHQRPNSMEVHFGNSTRTVLVLNPIRYSVDSPPIREGVVAGRYTGHFYYYERVPAPEWQSFQDRSSSIYSMHSLSGPNLSVAVHGRALGEVRCQGVYRERSPGGGGGG